MKVTLGESQGPTSSCLLGVWEWGGRELGDEFPAPYCGAVFLHFLFGALHASPMLVGQWLARSQEVWMGLSLERWIEPVRLPNLTLRLNLSGLVTPDLTVLPC